MATRPTNLTVISQTPVTSYRASATPVQLRRLHLCRVQPASAIPLEERFPLNTGGFWGYAFSLPESQIYFYQLKAGESFGPLTPRIAFSSSDWAVLTLIATPEIQKSLQDTSSQQPRTRDQETQTPRVFKGAHEFPPFTQQHRPLNAVRKTVTYAQWETKSTPFCSILSASSCFYSSREPRDGSCYSTAESPPGVIISGRNACRFAAPASITSRLELAPPPCSRLAITRTDPGKQPSLRCLALGFG
ncbi:hypothetical protein ACER0C_002326 [Sarotherodon galilaeus]